MASAIPFPVVATRRFGARNVSDIIAILTGGRDIPELGIAVPVTSDLAAFFDGYQAGQRGEPVPKILEYDEPSIYRRAHERGRVFRNS